MMKVAGRFLIITLLAAVSMLAGCRGCGGEADGPVKPDPGPPPVMELGKPVTVSVEDNLKRLLDEEDTDGDKKITVADQDAGGGRGDKAFVLKESLLGGYEIKGTYYLSNLLQELALAREAGKAKAEIAPERIREDAPGRVSRLIRERYWDGLTRRVDEDFLSQMMVDPKVQVGDTVHYLYVPAGDQKAFDYFSGLAARRPEWNLRVVRLPEKITPEYVKGLNGRHGVLALKLEGKDGKLRGMPFVVPGGRFNELYGWDSYFEARGLIADGRVDLARAMVDNFVYEIEHYGMILNANRSYYLLRSQPPFLTSMALAVYEKLPDDKDSKAWLARVMKAAIREYETVWTAGPRLTDTGLSRYAGEDIGPCPEVEPGHYDRFLAGAAKAAGLTPAAYLDGLLKGTISNPDLDYYWRHDRAMRESGHDTSYRFDDRAADFIPADLNSLLYKYERDLAWTIEEVFGGKFEVSQKRADKAAAWKKKAETRKARMLELMVIQHEPQGKTETELLAGFFDYDLDAKRRSDYVCAAAFYPLWAGIASDDQANYVVNVILPRLETPGGIAASAEVSRGPLSAGRPARQWDYPYGWPPHQMIAWEALRNYGYDQDANRLIYKWLYMIAKNAADYNGTVPEKFDVALRSHDVFAEYGNQGTKFDYITREGFGWMNASFQVGLQLLPPELLEKLKNLVPPEEVFK